MDLGLTRRGDYVLRAGMELAVREADGGWHKASDIAEATAIPVGYIRQILRMLVQVRIVEAHAGKSGGYRLARAPEAITVLELVETAEGPLTSGRCVMRGTGCDARQPCQFHDVMVRGQEALRAQLRDTTLSAVLMRAEDFGHRSRQ